MNELTESKEQYVSASYTREFSSDAKVSEAEGEPSVIMELEEKIAKLAAEHGWLEVDIERLQYGFREIFMNAIVHGNLRLQKTDENQLYFHSVVDRTQSKHQLNKKVRVTFTVSSEKITIVIQDQGAKEINLSSIPKLSEQEVGTKGSGRGVDSTKNYFDEFDIHPLKIHDKFIGTEVVMTKFKS